MPKTANKTSKKPTIAVDLDDVLAASVEGFVKFSNETWGTNLKPEDFHEDLAVLWGVDYETVNHRLVDYDWGGAMSEYIHFKEAIPILKRLKRDYRLVLVTSRRQIFEDITKQWVERYMPGIFSSIHHTGIFDGVMAGSHKLTKDEVLKGIGADYLIDDQPKHCLSAAKAGIESLLFGDYGWSKDVKLAPGVTRVKDWAAVQEYFDGRD